MDEKILKELNNRKERVERRLDALRLEEKDLIVEIEHITPLLNLYNHRSYDPIIEEHAVTENILKSSKNNTKTTAKQQREERHAKVCDLLRAMNGCTVSEVSDYFDWTARYAAKQLYNMRHENLIKSSVSKGLKKATYYVI